MNDIKINKIQKRNIIFATIRITFIVGAIIILAPLEKILIYPGTQFRQSPAHPSVRSDLNLEIWKRPLSDEDFIEAFFIPAKQPSPRGTVLFAHGNGELIDDWMTLHSFYYENLNYNLLLIEYRGYGRSGGKPHQKTIIDDYSYFYDKLLEDKGPQNQIVFHGRSLGGGVVAELTKARTSTHLILESTFTRLTDIALQKFFVPGFLISNKYQTLDTLKKLQQPVLVIHGTDDQLIPVEHGKKLYSAATEKKNIFLMDCGHNDLPPDRAEYWRVISQFLEGD